VLCVTELNDLHKTSRKAAVIAASVIVSTGFYYKLCHWILDVLL